MVATAVWVTHSSHAKIQHVMGKVVEHGQWCVFPPHGVAVKKIKKKKWWSEAPSTYPGISKETIQLVHLKFAQD